MNITLIGFGRMGQAIARKLSEKDSILAIVDPEVKEDICGCFVGSISDIPSELLKKTDVFIEFTLPETGLSNIKSLIELRPGAKIVSGTTGWDPEILHEDLTSTNSALLHSANFSLGVNLMKKLLSSISTKACKLGGLEASMIEYHHKNKKDAPSGTAKMLVETMTKNGTDCPVSCVRSGYYPGTHILSLDSEFETIEIKHTARNRDLFSIGALISARWLVNQKTGGLYGFDDVLEGEVS